MVERAGQASGKTKSAADIDSIQGLPAAENDQSQAERALELRF
jgi:hypothetical protein